MRKYSCYQWSYSTMLSMPSVYHDSIRCQAHVTVQFGSGMIPHCLEVICRYNSLAKAPLACRGTMLPSSSIEMDRTAFASIKEVLSHKVIQNFNEVLTTNASSSATTEDFHQLSLSSSILNLSHQDPPFMHFYISSRWKSFKSKLALCMVAKKR